METPLGLPPLLQKALLICGIIYALLTLGTDVVAGLLTRGYRFDTQTANTFGGVGTATRPFVLPIYIVEGLLLLAFAAGVWFAVDRNWALRLMACLLALNAILTMMAVAFFPFHPAEAGNAPVNGANLILMATGVIVFVLAVVFGAVGNPGWFRWFSIGVLLLFVVGALLSISLYKFVSAPGSGTSVGIQERTMIYAEMLWLVLQALVLLRV